MVWDAGTISTGSLLALGIILILTGKLVWGPRQERIWEARLDEHEKVHADTIAYYERDRKDALKIIDTQFRALSGSIHNNTQLIGQADEMLELTRLVTPIVIAQTTKRQVVTPNEEE